MQDATNETPSGETENTATDTPAAETAAAPVKKTTRAKPAAAKAATAPKSTAAKPAAAKPKAPSPAGTPVAAVEMVENAGEDLVEFSHKTADAMSDSFRALAGALESLAQEIIAAQQSNVELGLTAGRQLTEAKTFQDVATIQFALAQKTFDKMIADMGRFSEAAVRASTECLEPITKQFDNSFFAGFRAQS